MSEIDTEPHSVRSSDPVHTIASDGFYEYPPDRLDTPVAEPTPRTHKRSVRSVLIVNDDATVIRHSQLRALLELAGDTRTLGEAIGVHQSTISRALASSASEPLSREQRIEAVRLLIGSEEGS